MARDHRGIELKEKVKKLLHDTGHQYKDFGCYDDKMRRLSGYSRGVC